MIQRILSFPRRVLRRLHYDVVLAPRGYGKPIEKEEWERQYDVGGWNHLGSLDELAHYMAIIGYIRSSSANPNVVDVGCGHGRLLELLAPHFATYLGIDIASNAIARAKQLSIPNTRFEVASFEDWTPTTQADVLVFNESLSYAGQPSQVLSRYLSALAPNGNVVISFLDYGNHSAVWKKINHIVRFVSETHIRNDKGQEWDVRLCKPN
jgi:2-polyprenyl-3-methyl-5-hydroxy-6-metoxy-1,4-benzoquinol methylase